MTYTYLYRKLAVSECCLSVYISVPANALVQGNLFAICTGPTYCRFWRAPTYVVVSQKVLALSKGIFGTFIFINLGS